METKNKQKIGISVTVLIALLLGSLIGFTIAQTPTNTFYIEGSNYPGAPTYTVWIEGSYAFAKDQYGYVEFSSTDHETVIQACLDELANAGGSVFLKTGDYDINTGLDIYNNSLLYGESIDDYILQGYGTRLVANSSITDAVIGNADTVNGNINIEIRNLAIDGNKPDTTLDADAKGIHFNVVIRSRIVDVTIYNCKGSGIYLEGSGSIENEIVRSRSRGNNQHGIYFSANSDFKVYSGEFGSNEGDGIVLASSSHGLVTGSNVFLNDRGILLYNARYMRIISNRVNTNDNHGIYILSTSPSWGIHNHVSSNDIYDNGYVDAGSGGIYLNSALPNEVTYNIISDNIIYDATGNYHDYGIRSVNDGCDYNAFLNNICVDADTVNIQIIGANSEVHTSFNGTSWIT
jgi:parallel beta-helix repeat protein